MEPRLIDKVIIIDDQFEEALPIINALSSKGIYSAYWNGHYENQPSVPLSGVRLVILDIQFSSATDQHLINTNLFGLLSKSVSLQNGPYILCMWSKHNNEYYKSFKSALKQQTKVPQPYLITNIEKSDFVEVIYGNEATKRLIATTIDDLEDIPFKLELRQMVDQYNVTQFNYKEGSIEKLFDHLNEKISEMNSLSTLLIWENIVSQAANSLVNDIASLSDSGADWDNNIKNIIQRLAIANAGKSLENSDSANKYVVNALASLNHMLPDELWNQVEKVSIDEQKYRFIKEPNIKLSVDDDVFSVSKIKKFSVKKNERDYCSFSSISEVKEHPDVKILESLHNQYINVLGHTNFKLLCEKAPKNEILKPGKLFYVNNQSLLNEMAQCVFNDSKFNIDPEDNTIKLVKLDISSSCDYAQNKLKKVRVLFGIIVDSNNFSKIQKSESIYCTPELKIDGKLKKIIFSFHYLSNESQNELNLEFSFLGFRELLLTDIKHYLTAFISRVGIIKLD
ncbi:MULTISPECIES: hypothetical protein [Paenibacillus]|uniref:hypothetical protein n=1 Tax=Paenibacillus TaxID=44249 RepID=UPI002DB572A5|nr:hypothetical protein [Paenibacillus odorifer]MEC0134351.1 hypothetical protein [Paenibacillus odorifer]MEC0222923.1 hypothetical protein [Paenibacillus odorifer]